MKFFKIVVFCGKIFVHQGTAWWCFSLRKARKFATMRAMTHTTHTTPARPAAKNPLAGHVVAIDGPAGAGKGTLAKALAFHYRMKYLDTGTLYRTLALCVVQTGGDPADEADALAAFDHFDFDFRHIGNNMFAVFLAGKDITADIRTMAAGVNASKIAKLTAVRNRLKAFQVDYAHHWQHRTGVILDGQDIGTVICPEATFKFFIDASAEVRAERRHKELVERGQPDSFQTILAGIKDRDQRDRTRPQAPLVPADDAVIIDTSHLDAAQVLACAMAAMAAKGFAPALAEGQ